MVPPDPPPGAKVSLRVLTRDDRQEFLALAPQVPVRTQVTRYPLEAANDALADLRHGRFSGAAVLTPSRRNG